jgi:hypothetical protein
MGPFDPLLPVVTGSFREGAPSTPQVTARAPHSGVSLQLIEMSERTMRHLRECRDV